MAFAALKEALDAHDTWDAVTSKIELCGWERQGMRRFERFQNELLEPSELASSRFIEIPALRATALFRRSALVELQNKTHANALYRDIWPNPQGVVVDYARWTRRLRCSTVYLIAGGPWILISGIAGFITISSSRRSLVICIYGVSTAHNPRARTIGARSSSCVDARRTSSSPPFSRVNSRPPSPKSAYTVWGRHSKHGNPRYSSSLRNKTARTRREFSLSAQARGEPVVVQRRERLRSTRLRVRHGARARQGSSRHLAMFPRRRSP